MSYEDNLLKQSNDEAKEIEIWNAAVEQIACKLKQTFPDHAFINAYCAAVRSMKK